MRQLNSRSGRRQKGVSAFEFLVAFIIIAFLAGALLQRIALYQHEAETASVERLVGALRSALLLNSSRQQVNQVSEKTDVFIGQNPMLWLREPPSNYQGEFYAPLITELKPGYWHFDKSTRTLVYLPNHPKIFPQGITKLLKFKVESIRSPQNTAEQQIISRPNSLALVQVGS